MPLPQAKSNVNPKVGSKGLNLYDPSRAIGEFQLRTATNVRPTPGGTKSMFGYSLFSEDTSRTGGITALAGYRKADGTTKQLVFANDDDWFSLTASAVPTTAWGTVGDMGTAVAAPTAFTYNDYLIFGTGLAGNTPKKWDGTNFTSITTPPVAGNDVLFFEKFQGQDFAALFAAGDPSNPSRLYWSDANNPDVWTGGTSGYIDIAKSDGFKITALRAQGTQLIVYKGNAKYFVSTYYESATDTYGLKVNPYVDNSGGATGNGTVQVLPNGDVVSIGGRMVGIQALSKNESPNGDYLPKDYSRDIRPVLENINWSKGHLIKTKVYDNLLFVAIPYGRSASVNNYVLIFDPESGWAVLPDVPVGCWEVFEDENGEDALYSGDSQSPKIYKWSKSLNTFDGNMIFSKARTGKINIGSIVDQESFNVLALEGFMQEGDTLLARLVVDGVEVAFNIDKTFIVSPGAGGSYLGNDYIAEEYLAGEGDEFDTTEDMRWLAYLAVPTLMRVGKEFEVQVENVNVGARWGWNHRSVNELRFDELKGIPQKHVVVNFATV